MNAERLLVHYERIADAPDAIARLRRFVLDLAVRGKLVPQDPTNEPASELLKRIAKEKARLGAKALTSPLEADEIPFELPAGWSWSSLGEVCSKTGSGSTPRGGKEAYTEDGIPFLRSQNVYDDGLRLNDVAYIDSATHERMGGTCVLPGDLLLNITGGSMGRCCRVPDDFSEANVSQHVAIIRPALRGMEDFLHRLVLSPYFQSFIFDEQTGAGRGGLPKNRMDRIAVALPPFAEQHRIVARVDELMALCDRLEAARAEREATRDRLAAASLARLNAPDPETFRDDARFALNNLAALTARPDLIKQLRQTILNLAVRGKLVRQDPNDEPASELLKRIAAEKARLVKAGELKKDKEFWEGLPRVPPYVVPANWRWARMQDVFEISRGGSPRPAGDPRFFGGPIPWITVQEITKDDNKYLTTTETGLTEEGVKRSRIINPGDLLLTNSGATLGVPKISKIRACMNDGVAVLRQFHSVPLNDFSYLYLQSQTSSFRTINQGMGQPNLNTPIIAGWFLALPPLAEQHHIVAKVDELMALCEQLESSLTTGDDTRRRLLDALLAEALEPAEVLDREAAE